MDTPLSLFLYKLKINACGTVQDKRKWVHLLSQKLSSREIESMASDSLRTMKWRDKPDVRMLSSLHFDETEYWKA